MKLPFVQRAVIEATREQLEVELRLNPRNRLANMNGIKKHNWVLGAFVHNLIEEAEMKLDCVRAEIESLYALCELTDNWVDRKLQEISSDLTNGLIIVFKSLQAQLEVDELEETHERQPVRHLHLPKRSKPTDGDS